MRMLGGVVLGSLLIASGTVAAAEEIEDSPDYKRWYSELRGMVESRNMDKFEFDFKPMRIERVVMEERHGPSHTYHYLTFRLRNRVSANAQYILEHRSAFNEVMDQITKQYEDAIYQADGGARLMVEAGTIEDPDLATIVESEDLKVATRQALITVTAYDENGTTFRLFEEDPLNTPIDLFDFEDFGEIREGNVYHRVKDRIEEIEGRRLHSVHDIRQMELKPYDPDKLDDEGVAQGEVYGVLIFDRLPPTGDFFTIRVQGLSNKMRKVEPEHSEEELADYINTRFKRRVYEIQVERTGDEFFRDQDELVMVDKGWEWVPAFERIRHRATMAYSEWFLENHPLEREETETVAGKPSPKLKDDAVDAAFWEYMQGARQEVAKVYEHQIEQVDREKARVEERYADFLEGDRLDEAEVLERLQNWKQALDTEKAQLQKAKKEALDALDEEHFEDYLRDRR